MTIKYIAGNRVQGTRAERFPSLKSTGISLTGCKAYYPFNNSAINHATTANGFADGLGSTTDGTYSIHASGGIVDIEGVSGNGGLEFSAPANNTGAVIDLGNAIISGTGDFTYACWCNLTSGANVGNRDLIGNYGTGGSGGNTLYIDSSANLNKLAHYGGSSKSALALSYNVWNHCVATRTSGEITLYLNGTANTASTWSNSISGTTMKIGAISNTSECFNGGIAEVSIWNRALTAAEIGKLASSGLKNGTVFEETDTHKSYIWNATTKIWTEIT